MKQTIFIFVLMAGMAISAAAQAATGRLIGTVSGPGGLVPNATVTLIDNQTKKELTAITNEEGGFTFSQLTFGTYTLAVSATGYKTTTATDLKIDAGREYSREILLEIGAPQESVTIVAGADVLNSTNAELSTTVGSRQVQELPLNGRNPLALLNTVAGSNATSGSINGQRTSSVNYTRDGINVQDNYIRNGFVSDRPSVDDTGEFTVTTQNAGAELGGGGSTQVQLVTPRGGTNFHGAAFEYNRNVKFAANDFFSNLSGNRRPFLNRNQFGGRLSGPLPLPRFGEGGSPIIKNKGFFFVAYERYLLRQQATISRSTLLPQARDGSYTYTASDGSTRTVNVLSGSGLSGTVTPLTIDPLVQSRILNSLPTAGNGDFTGINLIQAVNFNQADNDTRDRFTSRFDIDVNDRNNVNFVYSWNKNADDRQSDGGGFGNRPYVVQGGPTNLYTLAWVSSLQTNLSNEVRFGYQRSEPFFDQTQDPQTFLFGALPLVNNPEPTFRDQGRNTDLWSIQDNLAYTLGNHTLRVGGMMTKFKVQSINFAGAGVPTYSFSTTANPNTPGLVANNFPGGIGTADLARANQLRYLLAGVIGSASLTSNLVDSATGYQIGAPSIFNLGYDNYSGYISDQWRVTPQLILNLGLRYDYFTPVKNPQQIYLEPKIPDGTDPVKAILDPNGTYQLVGGNAGKAGYFNKPDKNNFGPIISFAYSPNFGKGGILGRFLGEQGKTVFRGGFRVSYVNDEFIRSGDNALLGNQGAGSVTTTQPSLNARPGTVPAFTTVPVFAPTRTYAQNNGAAFNYFGTVFAIDPNLQAQKNYEYNIGIQRELGYQTAVEIRYVGGMSNDLVRTIDYNQIDIRKSGFLDDFLRAQNNCRLQGATVTGTNPDPLQRCTSAAYNPAITGSQQTPIFNQLSGQGFLTDPTILGQLRAGTPADLALIYLQNNLAGGFRSSFLANPNTGVANVLTNGGKYRYNALQAEIRRRFNQGLTFQANYTFQKILADTASDSQNRVDPYLDNLNPRADYARPDYDRTHTVNINGIYELPFGKGKKFLNQGGITNFLFGGFQIGSLINISSGEPTSIIDARGVLNRGGRSGRQPANSSLSTDEIKKLIGIYRTPNGVFAIDPNVLYAVATPINIASGLPTLNGFDLTQPLPAGYRITSIRGANPYGTAPFASQVFFPLQPGQTGNLPRSFINGPWYFNWDASLLKNFNINENNRIQLRMEVFNVLNRANFFTGENSGIFNIAGTNFGRITAATGTYPPRIIQLAVRYEF